MSHPNTHPSLTKLSPSLCPQHNLSYETYCSAEGCQYQIRVCPKCRPKHSHHSEKYFTPATQVVSDITMGLKRCFDKIDEYEQRTKELTRLINNAQSQCKQDYQQMENNLIQRIKQDKKILQKKLFRMQQIQTKLKPYHKLKIYFTRLQQSSLLQLKIKLSNQKGMLQLKENNQRLCQLMSKSNFEEVQKLYTEFYRLRQEIDAELHNNFTYKLGQVIALKNVKKIKGDKPGNEKENNKPTEVKKEKNKPKTMTNFGQGFINGILNFLNL